MKLRILGACALILGSVWSCRAQMTPLAPTVEPTIDSTFTSTSEIRALAPMAGGQGVWAATSGGVLRFDGKKWTKWTRREGLPSHEAGEFLGLSESPTVRFPTATAQWKTTKWETARAPVWKKPPLRLQWRGQAVTASLEALQIGEKSFPMPPESQGTHISAVLDAGKTLLVAIYGDGLWDFNGQKWEREAAVPPEAREITAVARSGSHLWLGTRRAGIWSGQNGAWQQHLQPEEVWAHNIQFFGTFRGTMWASTLDDGLIYRSGATWNHIEAAELSSSAPRQMVEFGRQLFVRHGGGLVDSFNGRRWDKDAFKTMPRRGVYALAANETTLFAAGWGGWTEWDGAKWTPHFEVPELKGVPLMGLLLDGDNLWIATQSRGLGLYHRGAKTFRWFDERDGLPDDWVTATAKFGGKIYAGTFVGGLARLDGEKWHVFENLRGENVTALAESGGKLMVGTRTGVWEVQGDMAVRVEKSWLDSEVQALWAGKTGLWVGARTSLNWLKNEGV